MTERGVGSMARRRNNRGSSDDSRASERPRTPRRVKKPKLAGDSSNPLAVASDQGSTGSLSSDASSRVIASDADVDAAALALQEYWASSLDAVRVFIRKASAATVVRCLDWDAIHAPKPKMREKYSNYDLLTFLEICRDEISAGGITGNAPNQFGYRNIQQKLKAQIDKDLSRSKIKNWWDTTRRRYANWRHLQSAATGLGRNPETGMILASDDWWRGEKKECKVFRKRLLPFIDLHEVVFTGRLVVGDHGDVAGEDEAEQGQNEEGDTDCTQPTADPSGYTPTQGDPSVCAASQGGVAARWAAWNTPYVDLEGTAASSAAGLSSPPDAGGSASGRRKGKAKRTESGLGGSGGSSKRTKSDDRMIDISARFMAYKEKAQQSASSQVEDLQGAVPVERCMQLLKEDGYTPGDDVWTKGMHLFFLPYWRKQFGLCDNSEQRQKMLMSAWAPPIGVTPSMVQPATPQWGPPPGCPPGMVQQPMPPWAPPPGRGHEFLHPPNQQWQQQGHAAMPPWRPPPPSSQYTYYGQDTRSATMWQSWPTAPPYSPHGQPGGPEGWVEPTGDDRCWSSPPGGLDGSGGS